MIDSSVARRGGRRQGLAQQSPPILQSPPVQVGGDAPPTDARAALELVQPGAGRRDGSGRLEPADAVVDDLLDALREVEDQRTAEGRRLTGRPPQIRRQVAQLQLAHEKRQPIDSRPARPQADLLRANLLPLAAAMTPGADPRFDLVAPRPRIARWLAEQQQHASRVKGDDCRNLGGDLRGPLLRVTEDHQVRHPCAMHRLLGG